MKPSARRGASPPQPVASVHRAPDKDPTIPAAAASALHAIRRSDLSHTARRYLLRRTVQAKNMLAQLSSRPSARPRALLTTLLLLLLLFLLLLLIVAYAAMHTRGKRPIDCAVFDTHSNLRVAPPLDTSHPSQFVDWPSTDEISGALGPAIPGVSIIAACKDKTESMLRVLPTWLRVDQLDEIVIVDWSSSVPIDIDPAILAGASHGPNVRIIRVEGEDDWVLTRAFNLAARIARRTSLLRVDCDYALRRDVITNQQHNTLKQGRFVSGGWQNAHNENEVHLNGFLFINRAHFWTVGGYDERIQTYGFDDEDLYHRLENSGLQRAVANFDTVLHLPHTNLARAQRGVRFVKVQIDYNQQLLRYVDGWSANSSASHYEVIQCRDNWLALRVPHDIHLRPPHSLSDLVGKEDKDAAWVRSIGQRLHDEYRVPWDLLIPMHITHKEKLLTRLMQGRTGEHASSMTRRLLVLHAMHGLGNRLRALGSAMAYAEATDRELVVLWESDVHVSAKFSDLYNDSAFVVLSRFNTTWPKLAEVAYKWDSAWSSFHFYNYMEQEEKSEKGKRIVDDQSKHIYYKGAFVMATPLTTWRTESESMRALVASEPVKAILKPFESQLVDMGSFIGVHIRDRLLDRDIVDGNVNSNKEYGAGAIETINHWRSRSSYKNFIPKMRELLDDDPNTRFFLASDTLEIADKVRAELPDADIYTIAGLCDARAAECLQHAVADLTVLSKARVILGSQWSSFTEAAQRLSGKAPLYLAGLDFAVAPEDEEEANIRQRRLGRAS